MALTRDDIRAAQQGLRDSPPYPQLKVDGIYGPLTRAAVAVFQQQWAAAGGYNFPAIGELDDHTFLLLTGRYPQQVYGGNVIDDGNWWQDLIGGAGGDPDYAQEAIDAAERARYAQEVMNATTGAVGDTIYTLDGSVADELLALQDRFFSNAREYAASGSEAALSTALDTATQLANTASTYAGDARKFVSDYGGLMGRIALLMGVSIGTATAITVGVAGLFGYAVISGRRR